MIKSVIKSDKGIVLVFDENDEQLPEYQGPYADVKEKILRDAPPEASFGEMVTALRPVTREKW